jgi:glucose-1-phosphate thymidylyltransferase
MKGLVLAGGTGTRLHPLTLVTNKHLLPVYDRPMIHYPLATQAAMGIEDVMVVLGGRSIGDIVELLGDGASLGLRLTYRYQARALGIAHAIGLARDFVMDDPVCVALGDNVLLGPDLRAFATAFESGDYGAATLLYRVPDPERFGVAQLDPAGRVTGFVEKPLVPPSDLIPIGLYLLRPEAFEVIDGLVPSARGELEITDVLSHYARRGRLLCERFEGRWSDAGTIESLQSASALVAAVQAGAPPTAEPERTRP